jgi:hypothetical protein
MLERIPVVFGFEIIEGYLYETIGLASPDELEGRLSPGQRVLLYEDDHKEVEAIARFDASSGIWTFEPDETTIRELPYRKKGYGPWRILANGEPIAEFKAPRTYDSMGMTYGPFTPYPAYEAIHHLARQSSTSDMRFLTWTIDDGKQRGVGTLPLSIVMPDGQPVPANWVGITETDELIELGDEFGYFVEVNLAYWIFQDDQYWIDDAS